MALRLRYHDGAMHARNMPVTDAGRSAFEALEQARCEAIGARNMAGVAENLSAALDDRCKRQGLDRVTERDQAPIGEVMRLIAREAMTGYPPPPSARNAVDLWRGWLDRKGQIDWSCLTAAIENQEDYGREVRRLLAELDLDVAMEDEPESSDEDGEGESEDSGDQDNVPERQGEQVAVESDTFDAQPAESEDTAPEEGDPDGEMEDGEQLGADDPDAPGQPWRNDDPLSNLPDHAGIPGVHD